MWDSDDSDPQLTRVLPFEGRDSVSIEVVASPLVVGIIKGAADFVTRGVGQTLALEPYLFSFDPDEPEAKSDGLEFKYFCRRILNETHEIFADSMQKVPKQRQSDENGGCFGRGPGGLNVTEGVLNINVGAFIETETTYEIVVQTLKDSRMSEKSLKVRVLSNSPPILSLSCADSALCFENPSSADGKIYINAENRLGIRAVCSFQDGSNCKVSKIG